MAFQDHFSGHAGAYAESRPGYPAALFTWLASEAPGRRLAWDCGTGNGQAAVPLADHFEAVLATDPSAAQIANADPHSRVTYRVADEAISGLDAGAADLVTAAQAYHWFDADAFHREARRVLAPGGVVAVWCYGLFESEPAIDAAIHVLYRDIVGPHWPEERRHVESGYRTLPFPFDEITPPALAMEERLSLGRVVAYLRTWSAVKRYEKEKGKDPVALVLPELERAWGDPRTERLVRYPLSIRAGRSVAA